MTSTYLGIDISPRRNQCWMFSDRMGSFELVGYSSQSGSPDDVAALKRGLQDLEEQTSVNILDQHGEFHWSGEIGTAGVDGIGLTFSAGKAIRTAIIGLSEKFSLEPLRRLVGCFNTEIVLEINLQEEPNISAQLERLIGIDFDLLVISGGTNGGPESALRAVINNLRLLAQLRGPKRPQIVYAGNQALVDYAKLELEIGDDLHIAGNIQPESGREDLSFAYKAMLNAFKRIRFAKFPNLKALLNHPKVEILPSEFARSRIGQWLEQTQTNGKGVLQIHLEPEFGQLLASKDGKRMGVWENSSATKSDIEAVTGLLDLPVEAHVVAAYLLNKKIHPAFLPATLEELSVEMAWIRYRIRKMLLRLAELDPAFRYDVDLGLRDAYEPVLLSGSSLDRLPSYRHVFMAALDSVLPSGITTFAWDDVEVLAVIGALASQNSLLATQVIDSDIFTSLATVISVDSPLPVGQSVLRLEVDEGEGEVRQHHQVFVPDLKRIEVLPGQEVRVYLAPEDTSDVGMGMRGLGGWVNTPPSRLGVIVDARGRPIYLPNDRVAKQEARRDWLWELGA